MSILWSSADAARATDGRATRDWQAGGVSIDTRTIQPGDLFLDIIGGAVRYSGQVRRRI